MTSIFNDVLPWMDAIVCQTILQNNSQQQQKHSRQQHQQQLFESCQVVQVLTLERRCNRSCISGPLQQPQEQQQQQQQQQKQQEQQEHQEHQSWAWMRISDGDSSMIAILSTAAQEQLEAQEFPLMPKCVIGIKGYQIVSLAQLEMIQYPDQNRTSKMAISSSAHDVMFLKNHWSRIRADVLDSCPPFASEQQQHTNDAAAVDDDTGDPCCIWIYGSVKSMGGFGFPAFMGQPADVHQHVNVRQALKHVQCRRRRKQDPQLSSVSTTPATAIKVIQTNHVIATHLAGTDADSLVARDGAHQQTETTVAVASKSIRGGGGSSSNRHGGAFFAFHLYPIHGSDKPTLIDDLEQLQRIFADVKQRAVDTMATSSGMSNSNENNDNHSNSKTENITSDQSPCHLRSHQAPFTEPERLLMNGNSILHPIRCAALGTHHKESPLPLSKSSSLPARCDDKQPSSSRVPCSSPLSEIERMAESDDDDDDKDDSRADGSCVVQDEGIESMLVPLEPTCEQEVEDDVQDRDDNEKTQPLDDHVVVQVHQDHPVATEDKRCGEDTMRHLAQSPGCSKDAYQPELPLALRSATALDKDDVESPGRSRKRSHEDMMVMAAEEKAQPQESENSGGSSDSHGHDQVAMYPDDDDDDDDECGGVSALLLLSSQDALAAQMDKTFIALENANGCETQLTEISQTTSTTMESFASVAPERSPNDETLLRCHDPNRVLLEQRDEHDAMQNQEELESQPPSNYLSEPIALHPLGDDNSIIHITNSKTKDPHLCGSPRVGDLDFDGHHVMEGASLTHSELQSQAPTATDTNDLHIINDTIDHVVTDRVPESTVDRWLNLARNGHDAILMRSSAWVDKDEENNVFGMEQSKNTTMNGFRQSSINQWAMGGDSIRRWLMD